jgi:hypothetical protein
MREILLVVWLATIGADRIDLFAGRGPFTLTPFLALTPLVIGAELLRLIRSGRSVRLPPGAFWYALFATALLVVSLLSVFFSLDIEISAKRFALLLVQVYATLVVALLLGGHEDPERILVRGAYAGVALGVAFNVIQAAIWLSGNVVAGDEPKTVVFLTPWMYGPWIPRLSGPSMDMNRGAFLFLVYLFLLVRFDRPSRRRTVYLTLAVLSLIATLSRSAMLALAVTGALLLLRKRAVSVSPAAVLTGSLVAAGSAGVLLLSPGILDPAIEFLGPPLAERFSHDGSSSIHFALLEYGLEVGSASVKNALLGIGFGNSFAVLEEFFPGNEYGNFHSLYITYWVETGALSLCFGLVLMLYPFFRSGLYRPLLGGILAFNVFYQTTLEPLFWFILAAAWVELASAAPGEQPRSDAEAANGQHTRSPPAVV